ncbi:hypothetical protein BDF22DRAFT_719567 [Syncephalis plumigaleata]|nr:hypothetical protein BDF22DRAFT_719567 [Syncephalis plumigaleata]
MSSPAYSITSFSLLLLLLLLLLLEQCTTIEAKFVLTGRDNSSVTYEANDFVFRPEQRYNHQGMVLGVDMTMDEHCKLPPANTSDPDIQELVKVAGKHLDFAVFDSIFYDHTHCVEHVNAMAQIKLIIMTKPLTLFSLWNDDYFAYFLDNSFHRYLLSTPLKIIETKSTLVSFKDFMIVGQYKAYEYTATHDTGGIIVHIGTYYCVNCDEEVQL